MKKIIAILCLTLCITTGCMDGLSPYEDAILDGVANLNMNDPQDALRDFNKAIRLEPEKAGGYIGRANALNTLGQYAEAIKDYDKAVAIDPKLANAYVNRGIAHSHLGHIDDAIADYEKGLALDPEIDDPPGILKRLFDNVPNTDKGIRKHLEALKSQRSAKLAANESRAKTRRQ